jgi:hypothetical protein
LVFTLLVVVFAIFYFLGWSFLNWRDSYKSAGVRMSFEEFRRIYELAPSRWDRYSDYTYHRKEQISDDRGDSYETYISTSIAMETLFDFWRLLFWLEMRTRQHEREACFKEEKASLKSLSIMVEKDVENIRKKLEEEEHKAENLRQEIINRLKN